MQFYCNCKLFIDPSSGGTTAWTGVRFPRGGFCNFSKSVQKNGGEGDFHSLLTFGCAALFPEKEN